MISGNHFHGIGQSGSEDAIHLDNWRNVTVSRNEFDHIIESGNHTDCLQSVYGGTNLTFTRNYEHDNDCQGFFVKDGDATNVTVSDNLFVRAVKGPTRILRRSGIRRTWSCSGTRSGMGRVGSGGG